MDLHLKVLPYWFQTGTVVVIDLTVIPYTGYNDQLSYTKPIFRPDSTCFGPC